MIVIIENIELSRMERSMQAMQIAGLICMQEKPQ
jgi:hypothetical protein